MHSAQILQIIKKTIALAGLCLLTVNDLFAHPVAEPGKPNIIYIYADDMGYAELGCYGQQKIKTPNIDRLAKEGIRFTQHYTSTPVCAPARCMLLTGRNGGHSYIRGNYELGDFPDSLEGGQMPLPEGTYTIGHMFQGAGYITGAIGKWGLGMVNTTGAPNKQGFDYFFGYIDQKQAHNYYPTHLWENDKPYPLNNPPFSVHPKVNKTLSDDGFASFIGKEYAPDVMTLKAKEFIKTNKDKPFFLYLPYTIPHVSLQIPPGSKAYKMYEGKFDSIPYYAEKGYTPNKEPLAAYAAMITQLDMYVGEIMEQIKQLGLDKNTIIMFSSDNGTTFNGGVNAKFFNSVDGLRGLKMDVFEGGIREPFIARWPGKIPAGKVTDMISVQFDMMATFADLIGIKAPKNDGLSLKPTLLGNSAAQKQHEYLYFEYPEKGGQVAIRLGDWKGVKIHVKKSGYKNTPWMLFNLKEDRGETKNLAAQHPELIKRFDAIVEKEHQPAHIKEWEFINPKFPMEK
ncbi:arylsulfatase [Pedobacter sp. BS3]|nr:arylsulfatase [Pedobacter sp. BS3]